MSGGPNPAIAAGKVNRDARHLRCASCGERAVHFIVLNGFDVPACLRHLNMWESPNFAPSECMTTTPVPGPADEKGGA